MREFTARAVAATELEEMNTYVVVLAENSDGSGQRLEIQRAASFDEQDRKLGQDTYCLCTEEGATHYGGVTWWRLSGDTLEIALDPAAAKDLRVGDAFVVKLESGEEAQRTLRSGLQRVFSELR